MTTFTVLSSSFYLPNFIQKKRRVPTSSKVVFVQSPFRKKADLTVDTLSPLFFALFRFLSQSLREKLHINKYLIVKCSNKFVKLERSSQSNALHRPERMCSPKKETKAIVVQNALPNYHYLAMCVFQLMRWRARPGRDVGGSTVSVHCVTVEHVYSECTTV